MAVCGPYIFAICGFVICGPNYFFGFKTFANPQIHNFSPYMLKMLSFTFKGAQA
jgi:hypothetical protein